MRETIKLYSLEFCMLFAKLSVYYFVKPFPKLSIYCISYLIYRITNICAMWPRGPAVSSYGKPTKPVNWIAGQISIWSHKNKAVYIESTKVVHIFPHSKITSRDVLLSRLKNKQFKYVTRWLMFFELFRGVKFNWFHLNINFQIL